MWDGYRKARLERRTAKYVPSQSELLLEKICESFGTELLPAEVNPANGTKMVRVSQPAIVKSHDEKRMVLQFQSTRFSPLSSSRICDVFNRNNRGRELLYEDIIKKIDEEHQPWDALREVIDNNYITQLHLHR